MPGLSAASVLTPDTPPKVYFSWETIEGLPYEPNWPILTKWVWPDNEVPVLRNWVAIPERYRINRIEIEDPEKILVRKVARFPGDASFSNKALQLDLQEVFSGLRIGLELYDAEKKAFFFLKLRINLDLQEPLVLVNAVCKRLGIHLEKKEGDAKFLWVSARCVDLPDSIQVEISGSKDFDWPERNEDSPGYLFQLSKPKDALSGKYQVGTFDFKNHDSSVGYYALIMNPPEPGSRFSFGMGLGGTYLDYREVAGTTLFQSGITGKARMSYVLIRRALMVDASGYLTLLPVTVATIPANRGGARFYGINARLGYELPVGLGATRLQFLAGWYFWGMSVANSRYGIQGLAGPQVFVSARTQRVGYRSWSAYIKAAPIGTGFLNNLTSRELAIGGSYQLNSPWSSREWALSLDLSNTEIIIPGSSIPGISLNTISLGIQTSLF